MSRRSSRVTEKTGGKVPEEGEVETKEKKRKIGSKKIACTENAPLAKVRKLNPENKLKYEFADIFSTKWGVQFPDDFYTFYSFTEQNSETAIGVVGLSFTGPYDFITGKISKEIELTKAELYMHGRHYYDLPEMITLLTSENNKGFHLGYFRDAPNEVPQILVSNQSNINGNLSICGDNIFAAVHIYCKELLSAKEPEKVKSIKLFMKHLEAFSKDNGYNLAAITQQINKRKKKVKAICLNKIGLVIPVDKNGIGYRELPCSEKDLRKLLKKISDAENNDAKNEALDELQEIITLVQFANDECDYGMGYELGINLFAHGDESLNRIILHLLPLAYRLMGYELYSEILEQHLIDRKKDAPRSVIKNV